jgi:hypothetical protein
MNIIELHSYYGDAYEDRVVYVASDDISTISPLKSIHTRITFKGCADAEIDVVEDVNYVLAKWRETTRG